MKKIFVLSVLTSVAMICSCQKKDSAAEQRLAQRKAELDARVGELAERLNSLDEKMNLLLAEREKVLAEKDASVSSSHEKQDDDLRAEKDALAKEDALKDTAQSNASTVSIGSRGQAAAAELNARKSEVPAEVQALVADPSQMIDAMDKIDQERAARKQLELQQQAAMPAARGIPAKTSGPSK